MPRAGGDRRLNSKDRKRLKEWLFMVYDPDLGPDLVRCHLAISDRCKGQLDRDACTFDRVEPGGPYNRSNVQPACFACQWKQGGLVTRERRHAWFGWRKEADDAGIEWDGVIGA